MTETAAPATGIEDSNVGKAVCPLCEEPASTSVVEHTFTHGDTDLTVVLPVRRCGDCDLEFIDHVGERIRTEAVYRHHGLVTPWEIRTIREQRAMSRAAFAEFTGLGEATIKRWETGTVAQNRANDRYLRLLDTALGWTLLKRLVEREKEPMLRDHKPDSENVRFPHLSHATDLYAQQEAFKLRSAA